MTLDHILDTIFRAGVFRAMHAVPPWAAACIALSVVIVASMRRRR